MGADSIWILSERARCASRRKHSRHWQAVFVYPAPTVSDSQVSVEFADAVEYVSVTAPVVLPYVTMAASYSPSALAMRAQSGVSG